MKVKDMIAELQKADPEADVYRCWYVTNDSGTSFETGEMVHRLKVTPAYERRGKHHNATVEIW